MLGYQYIGNLHYLSCECPPYSIFQAGGSQTRKHLRRHFPKYFLGTLAGQTFHERVEYLVAELAIVNYDAFPCVLNDRAIELNSIAQRTFTEPLCSHVARNRQ